MTEEPERIEESSEIETPQETKTIPSNTAEFIQLSDKHRGLDINIGSSVFDACQLCNLALQMFDRLNTRKKEPPAYV